MKWHFSEYVGGLQGKLRVLQEPSEVLNIMFSQESYIEGQVRGIFDALYSAQKQQIEDKADLVLTDDAINMTLTDIINGGKVHVLF